MGAFLCAGAAALAQSVTYDGKPLFTTTDRTFDGAGKVELWTKADSVTRFDRIEIKPLP